MQKLSMDELNRLTPEEFKDTEKNTVVVVLDNVRSLSNVGSAFRTGDAFKIEKLLLCGITGTPPNREIQKTALGATETVVWEHHGETLEAVRKLKEEGYEVFAVEQVTNSIFLQKFQPEAGKKYAFVFGNEVDGVDSSVLPLCSGCLEIPQFGTKHSLNVSVTVGVVLWDYMSKTVLI